MLTAAELTLVAEEIRELALHARLARVGQPEDDAVVFRLKSDDGVERALLIDASRAYPRAHFVAVAGANPRKPPPFCEVLRARLSPSRLVDARVVPRERVLVLTFDVRDGETTARRDFVAELFGSKPNLFVLDSDRRTLAALHESADGARAIRVGEIYEPTSGPPKDPAPRTPWETFGPEFKAELGGGRLSEALDAWFTPRAAEARLAAARDELARDLSKARKKTERLVEALERDRGAAERAPKLRAEGELLKANLGSIKRGMKQIALDDWSSGEAVSRIIALDPSKPPLENAQSRFEDARRLERSVETTEARAGSAEMKLGALDAALAKVAAAADRDAVATLRDELLRDGLIAAPPKPPKPKSERQKPDAEAERRKCYRVFTSADGLEILVGRAASDNDELTFRVANGDDFWFHIRDYPGSHVIVRSKAELPQETLLDAATLAVQYSRADFAGKRDVSWTRRKWVQKRRGAPSGEVMLSQHKTLHLRCDPDRLKRLLGPERI